MKAPGIIGMGIKSIVLFHLDPERFPERGRQALYALYFLSNRECPDMTTQSSEFIMVDDKTRGPDGYIIMEHNYWYPYGLFSLYAFRVLNWIDKQARSIDYNIEPQMRYVYLNTFFDSICDHHDEDLKTMRAFERFEVPR
jgi:hypothetical protein